MIRKIAPEHVRRLVAGQLVVEASAVVRELFENAIDAGATAIALKISKDFSDIEIKDNGCGISKEDRLVIGEAHATSKIESFEDIYDRAANSYGFRGEAIYLIMSSCESMTIMSKTVAEQTGEILKFKNGVRQPPEVAAFPAGTTVKVCRVFARYPTREKMLATKGATEEANKVSRMILAYSFLHPKLRIVCNYPHHQKLPETSLGPCIQAMLGSPCFNELTPIEWTSDTGDYAVSGYWPKIRCDLSVPALTRGRMNDRMFVYVNHRIAVVKFAEKIVLKKWRESCLSETAGKYPFVVLILKIPTFSYDVNVAPDKRTFLFKNEDYLKSVINSALDASIEAQKEVDKNLPETPSSSSSSSSSVNVSAAPILAPRSLSMFAHRAVIPTPSSSSIAAPSSIEIKTSFSSPLPSPTPPPVASAPPSPASVAFFAPRSSPSASDTSSKVASAIPPRMPLPPSSDPPPLPRSSSSPLSGKGSFPTSQSSASSNTANKGTFPPSQGVPLSSFDPRSPLCVTGGPPSVPLASLPVAVFKAPRRQGGRYSPKRSPSSPSEPAPDLSLSEHGQEQNQAQTQEPSQQTQEYTQECTQEYTQDHIREEDGESQVEHDEDLDHEDDSGKRKASPQDGARKRARTDRPQATLHVEFASLASALSRPPSVPRAFTNEVVGQIGDAMLLADGQVLIRPPLSDKPQIFPQLYALSPWRTLELLMFKDLCRSYESERAAFEEGDILVDERFLSEAEREGLFKNLTSPGPVDWREVLRKNGYEVRVDTEQHCVYLLTFPVEGDLDVHHFAELVRLLLEGTTRFGAFRPNDVMDMLRDRVCQEISRVKEVSISQAQDALNRLGCIVSASKTVVCPHNRPLAEKIALPASLHSD